MAGQRTERVATYRLQFRGGMDFDRAAALVPYLARLGISHLYASPIFTATSGSSHGYDVVNYNEIEPALGGREGFERLSSALKSAGLGLMLDIVPNHMAASTENGWWRDVTEWGARARHARHFDIDWSRRLTLPVLDGPADEVIAAGEVKLDIDSAGRGLVLAYHDHAYPLTPPSYEVLARVDPGMEALAALGETGQRATPEAAAAFHDEAAGILDNGDLVARIRAVGDDPALIARLHDAQPWIFTDWREARRDLSYRRFFEVTGLVGVRAEDAPVFDEAHELVLELVREGHADGLRIDHVDGLSDPAAYLARLREAVGPDIWLVVEKIVEVHHETLRDWPIEGTTGYEFVAAMADLLQPSDGVATLQEAYAELTAAGHAVQRRDAAKRLIVTQNFEGELSRLVELLARETDEVDEIALRDALIALIVALPIYRTYGDPAGFSEKDGELLARTAEAATETAGSAGVEAVIAALATPGAWELRSRFQQLTGPAMAKAVEDTLFYRHTPILAENEVGCDPVAPPGRSADVHVALAERGAHEPFGLNATSTHDTKRGEDARARLYTLAGAPETWISHVERWRDWAAADDRPGPDAVTEWTIFQALAGIWPGEGAPNESMLTSMRGRFEDFLIKALREAKLRTSWTDEDAAYEASVTDYAARLLDPGNTRFLEDFHRCMSEYVAAGNVTSLAQTLVKLTAPGVPDIYQGSEAGDFSLVDPDNRRPPDFAKLGRRLAAAPRDWGAGLADDKTRLVHTVLAERRRNPGLYSQGSYAAVDVSGPSADRVFAYCRRWQDDVAAVVVPIRGQLPVDGADGWAQTTVGLPDSGRTWRSVLEPDRGVEGRMTVRDLFGAAPGAFLMAQ